MKFRGILMLVILAFFSCVVLGAETFLDMVLVEKGEFKMGDGIGDLPDQCKPVHDVKITYDFYIGKYEVTFEQFYEFWDDAGRSYWLRPSDEDWGTRNMPAMNVTWLDAIDFCNWLSEKEGFQVAYDSEGYLLDKWGNKTTNLAEVEGYRLPTEAEWEYAARGGNKSKGYIYSGSNDPDEVAWYFDIFRRTTMKVGRFESNELGIYDMSGNVWEWCQDKYEEDYYEVSPVHNPYNYDYFGNSSKKVVRGGCWNCGLLFKKDSKNWIRVAFRGGADPSTSDINIGFRVCRTAN